MSATAAMQQKPEAQPQQGAVVKPVLPPLGFTLENVNQGYRLANWLAKSALVPTALRGRPEDILVVLMTGREYGMPPMQSLRHLNVIEGKATMSAQMMEARVVRDRSVCEYFMLVESTEEQATYATKRDGWPREVQLTYTIKDAEKAGLTGKHNWKTQGPTMLRWRAISALARQAYPDLVEGIYTDDEADEIRARADELSGARAAAVQDALGERIHREAVDVESSPAPDSKASPAPADSDERGEVGDELPLGSMKHD